MNIPLFALTSTLYLMGSAGAQQDVDTQKAPTLPRAQVQVERREFPLRFVGREITNRAELLKTLSDLLTPNQGSLEYLAETQVVIVHDEPRALSAVAAELARVDVAKPEVQLNIRVVRLSAMEQGADLTGGGIGMLDPAQVEASLRLLNRSGATIIQAPQIVARTNERAQIFVGKKPTLKLLADGGVTNSLDPDAIDLSIMPSIRDGHVQLDLDLRSRFTSEDGSTFSLPLLIEPGKTAVFQKFVTADCGAVVFVTPMIIQPVALPARRVPSRP